MIKSLTLLNQEFHALGRPSLSFETHNITPVMPEYGKKSYWDDRYKNIEGDPDEVTAPSFELPLLPLPYPPPSLHLLPRPPHTKPFDWMCGWEQLESTISPLLPLKSCSMLVVGCGNAPFSAGIHNAGYTNSIHVDYSEVVIEQQRKRYPQVDFRVGDCLNLTEVSRRRD